ncbi:MAG TPA: DNA mismatch repair protein MutS [Polyangiaceae bacterium]|nr:DNA mismatch repair protein MutS [Polyangiaceae bacterium]
MNGSSLAAQPTPRERYEKLLVDAQAEADRLGGRSRRFSNLRGLAFGGAAISAIAVLAGANASLWGPVAGVLFLAFLALVSLHARILDAEDLALRRVDVNRAALARLTRDWPALTDLGEGLFPADHPYAADLDVFGSGSLFQRLSVARTRFGRERLAELLLNTGSLEETRRRQRSVAALGGALELRQEFEAHALGIAGSRQHRDGKARVRVAPNPEPFLRWAESAPELSQDAVSVWGSRLLPPLTVAALVGYFSFGTPGAFALGGLTLQAILALRAGRDTNRVFAAVSSTEGAFRRYGNLLAIIEALAIDDPTLQELRARLTTGAGQPSQAMARFRRWVGWFDLRHNGLIHPFVNLLLLWDIHCTLGLERWQRATGQHLRVWFDVIGWFEALSSLAGFAADEPDVAFPELVDGPARFEAEALAHPLLDPLRRVANDVSLPAPGQALLITGSNMSGKSTLLRAMGLASVLALAGAPVTCRTLACSRLLVRTSIRVADSLEQGVSHFYAEISKLKGVVDAAGSGEPVLFLLDEILHGTNSRERQLGARWVLAELLRRGALGAVSTHDQELCLLPDSLMNHVVLVHLRESVADGKMTFDYRVYPGPVSSGNALRLMRQVGLDVPLQ